MVDGLPSYSAATSQDPWLHIASYVGNADLPAAARVCERWNQVFMPLIWGKPSSSFGREEDSLYISLARFKRALVFARPATRRLTHTLHLPPAHPELYYGPNADWLRMILERLPELQSLLVAGLPFFDHQALQLLHSHPEPTSNGLEVFPSYHLKLLDASRCANATSAELAHLILRLPSLVYLDLSFTKAAKSYAVLRAFKELPHLQVLKLRAINLQELDLVLLVSTINKRVRSLDLRDNTHLAHIMETLVETCMITSTQAKDVIRHNIATLTGEWPSFERTAMMMAGIPQLNDERHDDYLQSALTSNFVDSPGGEQFLNTGIGHLKVADASVWDDNVAKILSAQSLISFDVGYIRIAHGMENHGLGKTLAALRDCATDLKYLRVNHDLVTRDHTVDETDQRRSPVHELQATPVPANAAELGTAEQTIYELEAPPVFELPVREARVEIDGTAVEQKRLPPQSLTLTSSQDTNIASPLVSPLVSPMSPSSTRPTLEQSPQMLASLQDSHKLTVPPTSQPLTRTYSNVALQYQAHIDSRPTNICHLHPFMLPNLQTLVLSQIPAQTSDPRVAQRIIDFISECAIERHWARIRADVDYALPPGRRRAEAKENRARSFFGLKKLVLEVVEAQHLRQAQQNTKSSVEDPDCEGLWSAAQGDFSFFHEDTEESGQPASELNPTVRVNSSDKYIVFGGGSVEAGSSGEQSRQAAVVDVVAEIARFRRDGRERHAEAVKHGRQDMLIRGFWDGEVTVIRQR